MSVNRILHLHVEYIHGGYGIRLSVTGYEFDSLSKKWSKHGVKESILMQNLFFLIETRFLICSCRFPFAVKRPFKNEIYMINISRAGFASS